VFIREIQVALEAKVSQGILPARSISWLSLSLSIRSKIAAATRRLANKFNKPRTQRHRLVKAGVVENVEFSGKSTKIESGPKHTHTHEHTKGRGKVNNFIKAAVLREKPKGFPPRPLLPLDWPTDERTKGLNDWMTSWQTDKKVP